jgi:hypothetical protein
LSGQTIYATNDKKSETTMKSTVFWVAISYNLERQPYILGNILPPASSSNNMSSKKPAEAGGKN